MSDPRVYAPHIRARLVTTAHFCEVVVIKFEPLSSEFGTNETVKAVFWSWLLVAARKRTRTRWDRDKVRAAVERFRYN